MCAISRARALYRREHAQLAARLAQRCDIGTPRAAVEIDREQPARVILQQGIDTHHLPALQMPEQLRLHRCDERWASTPTLQAAFFPNN